MNEFLLMLVGFTCAVPVFTALIAACLSLVMRGHDAPGRVPQEGEPDYHEQLLKRPWLMENRWPTREELYPNPVVRVLVGIFTGSTRTPYPNPLPPARVQNEARVGVGIPPTAPYLPLPGQDSGRGGGAYG